MRIDNQEKRWNILSRYTSYSNGIYTYIIYWYIDIYLFTYWPVFLIIIFFCTCLRCINVYHSRSLSWCHDAVKRRMRSCPVDSGEGCCLILSFSFFRGCHSKWRCRQYPGVSHRLFFFCLFLLLHEKRGLQRMRVSSRTRHLNPDEGRANPTSNSIFFFYLDGTFTIAFFFFVCEISLPFSLFWLFFFLSGEPHLNCKHFVRRRKAKTLHKYQAEEALFLSPFISSCTREGKK